jgi:hypothetical protein
VNDRVFDGRDLVVGATGVDDDDVSILPNVTPGSAGNENGGRSRKSWAAS